MEGLLLPSVTGTVKKKKKDAATESWQPLLFLFPAMQRRWFGALPSRDCTNRSLYPIELKLGISLGEKVDQVSQYFDTI